MLYYRNYGIANSNQTFELSIKSLTLPNEKEERTHYDSLSRQ